MQGVVLAELTYDELRRLQRKEMASATLVPLPEGFYSDAEGLLAHLEAELSAGFSLQLAKEHENTLKIIRDIYSRRESKILLRAMRAARTGEDVDGLASEEKTLLSSVITLLQKNQERFEHRLARTERTPPQDKKTKLKFAMDLPEFVGLDGNVYGPFLSGSETALAEEEARRLVRRGIASEI
jgi:DNA replication initiation complex subunit (GINS family)